jgi:hypothetical protein
MSKKPSKCKCFSHFKVIIHHIDLRCNTNVLDPITTVFSPVKYRFISSRHTAFSPVSYRFISKKTPLTSTFVQTEHTLWRDDINQYLTGEKAVWRDDINRYLTGEKAVWRDDINRYFTGEKTVVIGSNTFVLHLRSMWLNTRLTPLTQVCAPISTSSVKTHSNNIHM